MKELAKRWMEITFVVVITTVVLTRGYAFSQVVRALGDVYAQSIGALMSRN